VKVLELPADVSPREQGRVHGEAFAPMIAELADIRLGLVHELGGFESEAQILEIARQHLPVLAKFDAALSEELLGIAEGSGVDAARIVVLNHYTDLRDIDPKVEETPAEDDCSAVFARTPGGQILGQTWDMHGSAEPFVMMLHVPARGDEPEAWTFSITGCLGMTGMNAHGLGITINNLKSLDARVGIIWPALVRRVLKEASAEVARDLILVSPLGSGHHYLVADGEAAYGIETSGHREKVVYDGSAPSFVHTNHCIDPQMAAVHAVASESTTHIRYDRLSASIAAQTIASREDLWHRLGDHGGYPKSICTHVFSPAAPHKMRTCGGVVMDMNAKNLWAAPGCLNRARPEVFAFGAR